MSLESIRKKDQEATALLNAILDAEQLTYGFLEEQLRAFVMTKFSLTYDDLRYSDDLTELSALSLQRALRISKDSIADFEAGENCDGATSTDVKRTLLLVRVQKALGIKLSMQELMRVDTISDLAEVLWPHLER